MDKFKELREKLEKKEEELRKELRPFAKEHLKSELFDLTKKAVEKLTKEEWTQFVNPDEEAINKEIEEMIINIKDMLEGIPKIEKTTSLEELLTVVCFGDEKLLREWRDYLRKGGPELVCECFEVWQYAPIMYAPEDVKELIREYKRLIAEKAKELMEKERK